MRIYFELQFETDSFFFFFSFFSFDAFFCWDLIEVKNISARLVSKWSAFLAPKEVEASNDKSKRKSTDG